MEPRCTVNLKSLRTIISAALECSPVFGFPARASTICEQCSVARFHWLQSQIARNSKIFFFGSISPQTFRVDFTCLEEIAIALLHRNLSELVGIYGQAVQRNKHHCGRDGMFLHAFLVESKFLLICYLCTPLSTFHVTANPAALLVLQAVGQHVQLSA